MLDVVLKRFDAPDETRVFDKATTRMTTTRMRR
jgi:hypothetical protein